MQEISVPEMDLHIRKIPEGDEQERKERERYNETSRTMQEISVSEMDLHIRKITEGGEQEGKERGTTRLQGQYANARSAFQRWTFISERLQEETFRKGKREGPRDFKDNAKDQCSRDGPSYQKDHRRRRAGRERERDNETSRIMQEISVPEMDLHIRKIPEGVDQERRERCKNVMRTSWTRYSTVC